MRLNQKLMNMRKILCKILLKLKFSSVIVQKKSQIN